MATTATKITPTTLFFSGAEWEAADEEMRARRASRWLEMIREDKRPQILLLVAKREVGASTFYCSELDFVGDKSDKECGRHCDSYEPRNGKSGLCKHSHHTYMPDEPVVLKADGSISPVEGRYCVECGCTEQDCSGCMQQTGEPCHWVKEDLCSACDARLKRERG